MVNSRRTAVMLIVSIAVFACLPKFGQGEPYEGFSEYRSIFVDRFGDFPYDGNIADMENEINRIMQNAKNDGFTDVIWQVRGRGEALYNSQIEPRQSAEDGSGPLTPGFDPLQTAITAAHARGIKLHAWVNVTPLWRESSTPPAEHIFHNTAPNPFGFRLMDSNGNLEPASGWSNYSSVNPVLPEVHAHINNVVNEIATGYEVDGIHLDYIRYIPGTADFNRLPHDPIAHQMFNQATGLDGSNPANSSAYKNFIKGRITDLVASIKQTVDAAEVSENRFMELTASVWRDPDVGENDYMQDYRTWLEQDLVDVAMPMIYLSILNDHIFFDANLMNSLNIPTNAKVIPTLATYLHQNPDRGGGVELTLSEIQRAHQFGAHGVNFYDYPAFFNVYPSGCGGSGQPGCGYSVADRQQILEYFRSIEAPAPPPLPGHPGNKIDDFEANEGRFAFNYNHSPASQTFGLTAATTIERNTSEAQSGDASQLLNLVADGSNAWQLRHNSGLGVAGSPAANMPLAATGYVGFWLKTEDLGLTVQIALDDPGSADRSTTMNVVADSEWHLYQWNLEDDAQWHSWVTGDGTITGPTVTIDSIFFNGSASAQIYLDGISHNPNGPLAAFAVPGDYTGNGIVEEDDYDAWRSAFGQSVPPGTGADGTGDGVVDMGDYILWRKRMPTAGSGGSGGNTTSTPEPSSLILLLAAVGAGLGCFRR